MLAAAARSRGNLISFCARLGLEALRDKIALRAPRASWKDHGMQQWCAKIVRAAQLQMFHVEH